MPPRSQPDEERPHAATEAALREADPVLGALIDRIGPCGLVVEPTGTLFKHLGARDLTLADLAGWDDDAIVADLTRIKGIGRWTVEMLLLFHLGRPDVMATDDLGIQRGIELTYGLPKRPTPREVATRSERWRPHRSVAGWYLWRASEGR